MLSFLNSDSSFRRSHFLIRLMEEINTLLALSLIQMLRESIVVGVPKFFARFEIGRAFEDSKNFFRPFVASILASDSHGYFFSLPASADQPYRCGFTEEFDIAALRERLRKMTDAELLCSGKAAKFMCSPGANFGKPKRERFVVRLRGVRTEFKRRKKSWDSKNR